MKVLSGDFFFRLDVREGLVEELVFRLRVNDRKDPTGRRSEREPSRQKEYLVPSPKGTNKLGTPRGRKKANRLVCCEQVEHGQRQRR